MFNNVNLDDFWEKHKYSLKTYMSGEVTESLIKEIEEELGYKLPDSYIYLMRIQNGGMPKKKLLSN